MSNDENRTAKLSGSRGRVAPTKLAHIVRRTSRFEAMLDWYQTVLGAEVVHSDGMLAFLTYDDEHHRIAIARPARARRPAADGRRNRPRGVHPRRPRRPALHLRAPQGATASSPTGASTTDRPRRCTTRIPTATASSSRSTTSRPPKHANRWMRSGDFAANPIGVVFDPDELLARYRAGEPHREARRAAAAARGHDAVRHAALLADAGQRREAPMRELRRRDRRLRPGRSDARHPARRSAAGASACSRSSRLRTRCRARCTSITRSARILQAAGVADELAELTEAGRLLRVAQRRGRDAAALRQQGGRPLAVGRRRNMFAQPELERAARRARPLAATVEVHRGARGGGRRGRRRRGAPRRSRRADASRSRCGARFVVGCDGANSFVRQHLGATVTDLGFFFDWLIVDILPRRADASGSPLNVQICDPARPDDAGVRRPRPAALGVHAAPRREHRGAEQRRRPRGACSRPWGFTPAERRRSSVTRCIVSRRGGSTRGAAGGCCSPATPRIRCRRSPARACARACATRRIWRGSSISCSPARRREALLDTYASERVPHVARRDRLLDGARQGDLHRRSRRGGGARCGDDRRRARRPPWRRHRRRWASGRACCSTAIRMPASSSCRVACATAQTTGLFDDVVGRGWTLISPLDRSAGAARCGIGRVLCVARRRRRAGRRQRGRARRRRHLREVVRRRRRRGRAAASGLLRLRQRRASAKTRPLSSNGSAERSPREFRVSSLVRIGYCLERGERRWPKRASWWSTPTGTSASRPTCGRSASRRICASAAFGCAGTPRPVSTKRTSRIGCITDRGLVGLGNAGTSFEDLGRGIHYEDISRAGFDPRERLSGARRGGHRRRGALSRARPEPRRDPGPRARRRLVPRLQRLDRRVLRRRPDGACVGVAALPLQDPARGRRRSAPRRRASSACAAPSRGPTRTTTGRYTIRSTRRCGRRSRTSACRSRFHPAGLWDMPGTSQSMAHLMAAGTHHALILFFDDYMTLANLVYAGVLERHPGLTRRDPRVRRRLDRALDGSARRVHRELRLAAAPSEAEAERVLSAARATSRSIRASARWAR